MSGVSPTLGAAGSPITAHGPTARRRTRLTPSAARAAPDRAEDDRADEEHDSDDGELKQPLEDDPTTERMTHATSRQSR